MIGSCSKINYSGINTFHLTKQKKLNGKTDSFSECMTNYLVCSFALEQNGRGRQRQTDINDMRRFALILSESSTTNCLVDKQNNVNPVHYLLNIPLWPNYRRSLHKNAHFVTINFSVGSFFFYSKHKNAKILLLLHQRFIGGRMSMAFQVDVAEQNSRWHFTEPNSSNNS